MNDLRSRMEIPRYDELYPAPVESDDAYDEAVDFGDYDE